MIDAFNDLIVKLGASFGKTLHLDHNHACALRVQNKFTVQIQLDREQEHVLLAAFIKELPPGKYRENVFCEALKTNHLADPRPTLSFVPMKTSLTLHQKVLFAHLDPLLLEGILAVFIDTAKAWYEAISRGETSPAVIRGSSTKPPPFGLR